MISHRIVAMIEKSAHELSKRWIERVRADPRLKSHQSLDTSLLYQRCYEVYSELNQWLDHRVNKDLLLRHFTELGRTRYSEGIPLSEVLHGMITQRRLLYIFMDDEGLVYHDPLVMYQTIELTNRILVFFDRAVYYVTTGYEAAMAEDSKN